MVLDLFEPFFVINVTVDLLNQASIHLNAPLLRMLDIWLIYLAKGLSTQLARFQALFHAQGDLLVAIKGWL